MRLLAFAMALAVHFLFAGVSAFQLPATQGYYIHPVSGQSRSRLQMAFTPDQTSLLVSAVLDYSAEIESSVGTEVYTPIFQAGLSLFASGILAAFMAAFIISKSDSWEELGNEFERGKETQLIFSEMPDTVNKNKADEPKPTEVVSAEVQQQKLQDLKGLDI